MKPLRKFLQRMPFYGAYKALSHYPDYWYWKLRPHPKRSPHLLKQRTVREYGERYALRVLVETGTYYGEMVAALKNDFDRIFSIECDPELARLASRKFERDPKIRILEGESQQVLPQLLKSITEPALFWLDAGYYTWDGLPRDTQRLPTELAAIFGHAVKGHVVLIDDAGTLKGLEGALTVDELPSRLAAAYPGHRVEVKHNIVRITPESAVRGTTGTMTGR